MDLPLRLRSFFPLRLQSFVLRRFGSFVLLALGTGLTLFGPAGLDLGPRALSAQVPEDAIREIRSLTLAVEMSGSGASTGLRGPLETELRESLARAGILDDLPEPRRGECCVLRLDLRVVEGASRGLDRRGLAAFAANLELATSDRLGRLDTRVVLWRGRVVDDLVDSEDLQSQLGYAVRDLADDFVDAYLAVFPIR